MATTADDVASDLRRRIADGRQAGWARGDALVPGMKLPTMDELAVEYGVNRNTVLAAVHRLRGEGLVATRKGGPGLVLSPVPTQVIRWNRYDRHEREQPDLSTTFERQVAAVGWEGRVSYPFVGWVECPPDVAVHLGVEERSSVVKRARIRHAAPLDAEGDPDLAHERVAGLFDSWIPEWVAERAPAVLTQGMCGPGGSYSRIERDGGMEIRRYHEELYSRPATDRETQAFALGPERRLWEVERDVIAVEDGRVVTFDRVVSHPDHVRFVFEYDQRD